MAVDHIEAQEKTFVFVIENANLNGYEPENGPAVFELSYTSQNGF
jgi:hypothetical protein